MLANTSKVKHNYLKILHLIFKKKLGLYSRLDTEK